MSLATPVVLGVALSMPPSVRLEPMTPRLGDLVRVRVGASGGEGGPSGSIRAFFCEHPLVPTAEGWHGWIAVPTDTSTGTHSVTFELGSPDARVDAEIEIRPRSFDRTRLRVAPRFTGRRSRELQARLDREQAAFDEVWSSAPSIPPAGGPGSAQARLPVRGRRSGRFGTLRTFNGEVTSAHYGLDLASPTGRPVAAAWPGRVVLTGHMWGSGKTVVLDHGAGLFTLYFHLSRVGVGEADEVKAGEPVGRVGATGRVTGPHLHFAVAVQCRDERGKGSGRSMYVDPEPLLPGPER